MNEGAPNIDEQPKGNRAESYQEVYADLRGSLNVLEEAYKEYPHVTLPSGETKEPENRPEEALGRVQRYNEAIEGLLEKNAETHPGNEHHVEEALRLTRAGVEHLEGYLAVQADLYMLAKKKNAGAEKIAEILDGIARTLMAPEQMH